MIVGLSIAMLVLLIIGNAISIAIGFLSHGKKLNERERFALTTTKKFSPGVALGRLVASEIKKRK